MRGFSKCKCDQWPRKNNFTENRVSGYQNNNIYQAGTNYVLPVHKLSCTRRCLPCTVVHTKIVYSCRRRALEQQRNPLPGTVYKIQIRTNPQCLMSAVATFNLLLFKAIPCKSVQYWVSMSKLHTLFWESSLHVFLFWLWQEDRSF